MEHEQVSSMTVKESKSVTKDSICGMTVDETTALHAERDGHFTFAATVARRNFCHGLSA